MNSENVRTWWWRWPDPRYHSGIFLERLGKTARNVSQDRQ
jgi:hypothetical protein